MHFYIKSSNPYPTACSNDDVDVDLIIALSKTVCRVQCNKFFNTSIPSIKKLAVTTASATFVVAATVATTTAFATTTSGVNVTVS